MFRTENDNVMYKTPNMVDWIQYGTVITACIKHETDSSYIYQVLKFNLDTDTYELDTTVSDYYLDGALYKVVNGEFEVVKEKESMSEYQPTNAEIYKQQLDQAEMMLDQQLLMLEIKLNTGI